VKELTESVNSMASKPDESGSQYRQRHHGGSERRSFPQITVDVRGEILELKNTITRWWISSILSPRK